MMDDPQLLRSYAVERSEPAFAELVQRHVNLVYSTALRQANGDAHLAQDATQLVFTDLARKAASLSGRAVLSGWLFTSTRYAVARLIRGEQRRRTREQEAHHMDAIQGGAPAHVDWERLRPVLNDALAELSETDREAVLLRYFEGLAFAGIGTRLDLTENAARMRVERALDKLQALLARRGLTSSTAALAVVLANQAVVAAPAGLAATIAGVALAEATAGGAVGWIVNLMSINKLSVGAAGLVAAAGITGFAVQYHTASELRGELQQLRQENQEITDLQAQNLKLAKVAAEVEAMKADDAALAQLDREADGLKGRMQIAAQRALDAKAKQAVVDYRKLDRAPRVLTQARPEYPAELRTLGTEGKVLVDYVVDSTGTVRNAYAVNSTLREFELAAIAAVSQWTFEPGQKGGRAVNTHMQITIVFSVAKPNPTPEGGTVIEGRPKP